MISGSWNAGRLLRQLSDFTTVSHKGNNSAVGLPLWGLSWQVISYDLCCAKNIKCEISSRLCFFSCYEEDISTGSCTGPSWLIYIAYFLIRSLRFEDRKTSRNKLSRFQCHSTFPVSEIYFLNVRITFLIFQTKPNTWSHVISISLLLSSIYYFDYVFLTASHVLDITRICSILISEQLNKSLCFLADNPRQLWKTK